MYSKNLILLTACILIPFYMYSQQVEHPDAATASYHPFSFSGWNELTINSLFTLFPQSNTDSTKRSIGIKGGSVISSNALNLSFSVSALTNEFIDQELKNSVSEDLSEMNVFEYNTGAEIYYQFVARRFITASPALLSFTLRAGSVQQSRFTDDLFNLAFYGNAGYAGETADIGGTKGLLYDYRQMRFGAQQKFSGKSGTWETGLGASLLLCKNGSEIKVNEGTIYTETNGEFIEAAYNFEYMQSDTGNKGTLQVDGYGAAADLLLAYMPANGKSRWTLQVNDLGLIWWNKRTNLYHADSAVRFEGIAVNDFIGDDNTFLFEFNIDSLLEKTGTSSEVAPQTTALPTRFALTYSHILAERLITGIGMAYRPSIDQFPFLYIQPVYALAPWFSGGVMVSYGGTAALQVGATFQFTWHDRYRLQLASGNVLGALLPRQSTSTSLFLQAIISF